MSPTDDQGQATPSKNKSKRGRHFVADARVILSLGRDSIKDKATAVLELVKNSYDAYATAVTVEIYASNPDSSERFIRIRDNGHGMTSDDLDSKFLWIGFSEKRQQPNIKGRRRIGEKGIGRLSADRLGELLELQTQSKGADAAGLSIDWTVFEQTRRQIADIVIPEFESPRFLIPRVLSAAGNGKDVNRVKLAYNDVNRCGTQLTIRKLRQDWDIEEIESLWSDISLLTSPFRSTKDFQVSLHHDLHETMYQGVVQSLAPDSAAIEATFALTADGMVNYTFSGSEIPRAVSMSETWRNFYLPSREVHDPSDAPFVGPLEATLYFYLRNQNDLMPLQSLRAMLEHNAGVKVYRDGIRVMPYGDLRKPEGGDWLGLGDRKAQNPAGAGRKGYRIAPNQLVGAVFITGDKNPSLKDSTAREGLVHDRAFRELRAFVMGCIVRLESQYHAIFVNKLSREKPSPRQAVLSFGAELKKLRGELTELKALLPARTEKRIEGIEEHIDGTVKELTSIEQSIEELASQAIIYRGLASVGIASVVFCHETDSSLELFQSSAIAASNILQYDFTPAHLPEVIEEVQKAIAEADKISAWGKFALRRVKADKRRKKTVNLGKVVLDLVNDLQTVFQASSIELTTEIEETQGRAFQMDIESIVLNLLTNAYSFTKLSNTKRRRVVIQMKPKVVSDATGVEISVMDTGPGVPQNLRDRIWVPLFTTKEDKQGKLTGTGLGLSIVDDIVNDNKGTRTVDKAPGLGGARFTIWLPLS